MLQDCTYSPPRAIKKLQRFKLAALMAKTEPVCITVWGVQLHSFAAQVFRTDAFPEAVGLAQLHEVDAAALHLQYKCTHTAFGRKTP